MTAVGQRRGLVRSSPRPQCPQLPPIAGIRLIPNDRRLVPQPAVSRCSNTTVQRSELLDHFIGAQNEASRYFVTDRLRDLQVEHQLKSCRLFDRKLARFGAAQDLREQPC